MNDDPAQSVKRQEGYEQYRQAAGRTPLAKFPWGTLIGNAVGIAGAHAAGYYAGGMLANALANSPVGNRFSRLSPAVQRQMLQHGVAIAATIGAGSAGLASLAGQMRVAEEISRIESDEQRARVDGNEKKASMLEDYATVLRRMYL